MKTRYKLAFDPWGLALFLAIMAPNLIWFAVPAPNDVLRRDSATPALDAATQALQIILAAALCGLSNPARDVPMKRRHAAGAAACALLYFAGWAAYYAGTVHAAVLLDLCLAPCGAFLLFALGRKNWVALAAAGGFAACHLAFTVVNFLT